MSISRRGPEPEAMGVRELKANLSQVLKRVQAGQRVTITHHGVRVVDMMPAAATPCDELTLTEAIAKLDRKFGVAKRFDVGQIRTTNLTAEKSLSEQLLDDRGSRI